MARLASRGLSASFGMTSAVLRSEDAREFPLHRRGGLHALHATLEPKGASTSVQCNMQGPGVLLLAPVGDGGVQGDLVVQGPPPGAESSAQEAEEPHVPEVPRVTPAKA